MFNFDEPEIIKPLNYLYQYTYEELQDAKEPVVDSTGILWCGPNRRNLNAPNPVDLWRAWQKDVQAASRQAAGQVPTAVMDYFQSTKQFSRPPKTEESVTPKFTWSYSSLTDFESCPKYFAEARYFKTLAREETEATRWGTRVHTYAENMLKDQTQAYDPVLHGMVGKYVDIIRDSGGELMVEQKMALTDKLKPCDFFAGDAWGRGVIDVAIKKGNKITVLDYKTGKIKEDQTQLITFCIFAAFHYPDVEEFDAKFIWLKDSKITGLPAPLKRADLFPHLKSLLERIARMREAWDSEVFAAKPSGLCSWRGCHPTCSHYTGRVKI